MRAEPTSVSALASGFAGPSALLVCAAANVTGSDLMWTALVFALGDVAWGRLHDERPWARLIVSAGIGAAPLLLCGALDSSRIDMVVTAVAVGLGYASAWALNKRYRARHPSPSAEVLSASDQATQKS